MKILQKTFLYSLCPFIFLLSAGLCQVFAQEPQVARNTDISGDRLRDSQKARNEVENGAPSPASNAGNLSRVGVQATDPLSLTLNDAIRKALEGNNSIEISRDDVRFQETTLRSLLGVYDRSSPLSRPSRKIIRQARRQPGTFG
jgi:hypothetical protein